MTKLETFRLAGRQGKLWPQKCSPQVWLLALEPSPNWEHSWPTKDSSKEKSWCSQKHGKVCTLTPRGKISVQEGATPTLQGEVWIRFNLMTKQIEQSSKYYLMFRLQKEERATTDGTVSEDPFSTGTLKTRSPSLMSLTSLMKWISSIQEGRDFKLPLENV